MVKLAPVQKKKSEIHERGDLRVNGKMNLLGRYVQKGQIYFCFLSHRVAPHIKGMDDGTNFQSSFLQNFLDR